MRLAPGEYVALAHEGVRLGGPMTVAMLMHNTLRAFKAAKVK